MYGYTMLAVAEEGLRLAIFAGFYAALLAAVVCLINATLRRSIGPRAMALLWVIVLVRLVVPVAPASRFSLQNLLQSAEVENPRADEALHEAIRADATRLEDYLSQPVAAVAVTPPLAPEAEVITSPSRLERALEAFFEALPFVWLIGGAVVLVRNAVAHWRFCRKLRGATPCNDDRLGALWLACCQKSGLRREIPILTFDGIELPALLGFLRPRLLLPTGASDWSDDQLRMVMLHECAHVRYGDVAANWLLLAIRAIHWWNPIYWLAAARFQSLREQSCDTFALRRIEGHPVRDYSELLLTLAARQSAGGSWRVILPVSILGFFSSHLRKRALGNRVRALRVSRAHTSPWRIGGGAIVIALVALVGLTDARTSVEPPVQDVDWLPQAGRDWNHWTAPEPSEPAPNQTQRHDLLPALNALAGREPDRESVQDQFQAVLNFVLRDRDGISYDCAFENVGLWTSGEPTPDGVTLEINAPQAVHDQVVQYLLAWQQSGLSQICVETRFLSYDRDFVSAAGYSWQYFEAFSMEDDNEFSSPPNPGAPTVHAQSAVDEYLPVTVARINPRQAAAIIDHLQGDRRSNVLQAPKITTFNGQQATLADCSQTPFVVGVKDLGNGVAEPRIKVIDEGVKIRWRAVQCGDLKKIQLEARIELSRLDDVRNASAMFGGEARTIQIPRVSRFRVDVASDLTDGHSLLIGCIPTYEQKKFLYVLLTVRAIAQDFR